MENRRFSIFIPVSGINDQKPRLRVLQRAPPQARLFYSKISSQQSAISCQLREVSLRIASKSVARNIVPQASIGLCKESGFKKGGLKFKPTMFNRKEK